MCCNFNVYTIVLKCNISSLYLAWCTNHSFFHMYAHAIFTKLWLQNYFPWWLGISRFFMTLQWGRKNIWLHMRRDFFPEKPSHKKLKLTLGQQKIHTQPNQKKLFALKKLKATFLYLAHIRTLVSDVSKNVHLRKWMYICKYKFLYISYIKFF